ncbi:MAG TPA: SDR family oxidoreductase [Candidatus Acidoferrum sp.]|nr:SDR family oxidoreductase [Candidatus Acidoferrum sp.]
MTDIAVVCGATGGLGTAVVDAFVKRGDHVIAVARSRREVSQLESKYPDNVRGDTADLTDRISVDDLWERIDRVGVPRWLVNTTGGYRDGKLADSTPDDFSYMMDLNLASAWWFSRAAARRLKEGSAIVNVAARAGLVAEAGHAAYAVSKAAVIQLTKVLAAELKSTGVRVNVVVPAVIDTPANRRTMPEKLLQKAVPPADIAAVIAYLCSDAASAITGSDVPVFGRF